MKIINEQKYDFQDLLIVPKRSKSISRSSIDLEITYKYPVLDKREGKLVNSWKGIPIICANMTSVSSFTMARTLSEYGCMTALHKHYTVGELLEFYTKEEEKVLNNVFYTLGVTDDDIDKLEYFLSEVKNVCGSVNRIKNICIDVANLYTDYNVDRVKQIRDIIPDKFIMAGNIVTPNIAEELILNAGVSIIKGGIGPGAACTTRKMTGVGYPQLSMIHEVADACHGLDAYLCSDGGCTCPGDICKAFCAGADFVMLGGMLSGTDETEQPIITKKYVSNEISDLKTFSQVIETKQFVEFYGMSSETAQEKFNKGLAGYKASEGRTVRVPYKGSVRNIIKDILGGLRSCGSYIGAMKLKDFSKCATFVRSSVQENKIYEKYDTGKN